MNKYICMALVPLAGMVAQATPEVDAQNTIKATMSSLATLMSSSQDKELPALIADLDSLLAGSTPGILTALEPLTDEQRVAVIMGLMQSPELGAVCEALAPLSESKAAAAVMPAIVGEADPASIPATLPYKTKLQVVDIAANLLKIAIGLGIDSPACQQAFGAMMGGDCEDDVCEDDGCEGDSCEVTGCDE